MSGKRLRLRIGDVKVFSLTFCAISVAYWTSIFLVCSYSVN